MKALGSIAILISAPLLAQSGPPAPVAPAKASPAQQAIALYRLEHGARALPKPCRNPASNDVIVCGSSDGLSPYRVPLPDQRGPRDGARTATGEQRHIEAGGSPVALDPGVGLTLTVKADGKAAVAGNGD